MGLKEVWRQATVVDLAGLEKEIRGEEIDRGAAFDLFFRRVSAYGPGKEAGVVEDLADLNRLLAFDRDWLFIIIDGRNRRRPVGLMARMPASGGEEEQRCLRLEALKSGLIGVGGMSGIDQVPLEFDGEGNLDKGMSVWAIRASELADLCLVIERQELRGLQPWERR